MSKPQIFSHQMFGELPVIVVEGIEWFGATEAAKALTFNKPHDAVTNHVDEDDSAVHGVIDKLGRTQQKKFINESGLYSLIFGAAKQGNNPEIQAKAKAFKRWVTSEVLPTIRKHGAYMTPDTIEKALTDPDFIIGLATKLKEEQSLRIAAETKIEQQKPLVTFAEICIQSDKSIKIRDLAHSLTTHGIKIGERKLYARLRDWGMICKKSTEPTQKSSEQGLFEVVTGVKEKPDGTPFTWRTTYVTMKGQSYIANRLKNEMV
ncbi:phage antirepressor KilAC domain-containing protein [Brevibacillus sp. HD3.3A]|uniref:phage antirepressor KilAC domain-containing protein n=1 Tax=Brevibacillus sp. HD3.3A TaxID=2738979 RepID=UPI00156B66BB|nr:phage antirepressor KilAC domain-containing protein [Brevibacillus sp. HD3.3A]UED70729.1 phage antirepressor KilAC domain-containing protein [Brevibacillus sp. HD3.3A]